MATPVSVPASHGKWERRWLRRVEAEEARITGEMDAEAAQALAKLHAHLTLLTVVVLTSLTLLTAGFGEQVLVIVTCGLNGAQEYLDYLGRV